LTLPDSETFVPEFGIQLPPEFTLNFETGSPTPGARHEIEYNLNLSDPLQTPLHSLINHEFSLPGYHISAGLDSTDSAFGDYSGGFDDDDILRNADDNIEALDFNLDATPTRPPKRHGMVDDVGTLKRARYTSADGMDDEVQRIAREDHDNPQPPIFDDIGNDMGFGDPGFDDYRTPPPAETGPEKVGEDPAPAKKKRRIVIVEDEAPMIGDRDFRSWPAKYIEMQEVSHLRRKNLEMNRIAKRNAVNCVWGWGGKEVGSLPPLLNRLFSREALLQRWTGKSDAIVEPGKRKGDEDGEMEFGMGMGDNGGFDTMDYGVLLLRDCSDGRIWRLVVMRRMMRVVILLFSCCRCHGRICRRDKLLVKGHRIHMDTRAVLVEGCFAAVFLEVEDTMI
jgi:hypothetical protein